MNYAVQIQDLIDTGTLPDQDYDIDRFLLAGDLWRELKDLQAAADALFPQAETLPDKLQDLVAEAQRQYDNFNYLDAVRYLEAALGA